VQVTNWENSTNVNHAAKLPKRGKKGVSRGFFSEDRLISRARLHEVKENAFQGIHEDSHDSGPLPR
jgi:hypothetical protein